jgi:predicted nucleic acid-binding protein
MKVLFDTNVILDVFLQREPFFDDSSKVLGFAEQDKIEGWVCGTTVTTIHYLLAKALTRKKAEEHLRELLKIFHVSSVNRVVLENALTGTFKDYEDGVIYHSALHANLEAIFTRNQKDFKESNLPVYSPEEFLKAVDSLE